VCSYPYGPLNNEDFPGHLSAYSKLNLRWLNPTVLSKNGGATQVVTLRPAATTGDAYKIVLKTGTKLADGRGLRDRNEPNTQQKLLPQFQPRDGKYEEYLLLENRQAIWFDRDLNDRTGLVVYHVDEAVPRMDSRGYPGQPGWPHNGNHYRVSVLGADSAYHLERGQNKGDSRDPWKVGRVLGPGQGSKTISYPNTDTYQYGMVMNTGVSIEVLAESGRDVTVRIKFGRSSVRRAAYAAPAKESKTLDCANLWSSVDLEVTDENGEVSVESIECSTIAEDTDKYCELRDVSMWLDVWEVCRNECPQSECHDSDPY
jgi:hypothetical protein